MEAVTENKLSFKEFKDKILSDYRLALISREASLLGRREVLTGKAKFGIFGDGKELPQIAMAKVFKNGDFRSGYYRDQTFMFAIGEQDVSTFFAQLYANTDLEKDPASAGRQMNCHFATRSLNEDGSWKNLTEQKNSSPDISPTSGQMPRLLGLAQASKYYRKHPEADSENKFTHNGDEIAFGTIGDASTSEGPFWETLNAGGVLQIPMIISIWDDGYGISVPTKYQSTKSSLAELLSGFQRGEERGYEIIEVKAWDYPALIAAYEKAEKIAREEHVPCIVYVRECTQPQGHSTSGSHERYKSPERLEWEKEFDGIAKFKEWILNFDSGEEKLATEEELAQIETDAKKEVRSIQKQAWADYQNPILELRNKVISMLEGLTAQSPNKAFLEADINGLKAKTILAKKDIYVVVRKALRQTREESSAARTALIDWFKERMEIEHDIYSSYLYSQSQWNVRNVEKIDPVYAEEPQMEDGRIVLRDNFQKLFEKYPNLLAFGEDTGNIGDVNQGLEGLQSIFGESRISDTGIREATIVGQGIGLALRGLRPIAEIQYLDYLLYALQLMSDDLATVQYRTKGGQKAPVIVRTRGHRFEGIWHSGSPMGAILNTIRGIHVLVPRDLTKAAGFYNALMKSDEPALVIESLNGYRLKEKMPENLGEFTTPIGEAEITKEGKDITLVTYGSTWKNVTEAARELAALGIDAEVIDLQSLIPFDVNKDIVKSLQKTNRLVIIDEDVPGGASAYILQKIMEEQDGYFHLDSQPLTITAKEHRPAYASDGDYFSKPSTDDIIEGVYKVMHEARPDEFPELF